MIFFTEVSCLLYTAWPKELSQCRILIKWYWKPANEARFIRQIWL